MGPPDNDPFADINAGGLTQREQSAFHVDNPQPIKMDRAKSKPPAPKRRVMKILCEGAVNKSKDNGFLASLISQSQPFYMILTDQPRLYLMTELNEDIMVKQKYCKDIMLYDGIKARGLKRNKFEIHCPLSKKTYQYTTDKAGQWVKEINDVISRM